MWGKMAVWTLGSINADNFYRVPHIPAPGETLAATALTTGLGGKGTNMSVAAARAGAVVHHIGAVGPDGGWAVDRLMEYGVDTRFIAKVDAPTGHANVFLAEDGENAIVILPGANGMITGIDLALTEASPGDWLLMQNETNGQVEAARIAADMGLNIAYAAAPFDAKAIKPLIPFLDLLVMNEVEASQLRDALGGVDVPQIVVTLGAQGARHIDTKSAQTRDFPAPRVDAVDTTGAGDTFTGYLVAGLDRGIDMAQAISLANRAAGLMVQRHGTADVIPDLLEVQQAMGLS